MKKVRLVAITMAMITIGLTLEADPSKSLRFAVTEGATSIVDSYYRFLAKAYAELDINITTSVYPLKRTYIYANSGEVDGLLIVSGATTETFEQLIIVPVPLTHINLRVYSIQHTFTVTGIESIQPYRIGILRGYPLSTKVTENLERQVLNDYKALFTVLMLGRVDVVLAMERETSRFLKDKPELTIVKAMDPPLVQLPLYHLLNKKHKDLVPQITPIMERLISEGELRKLQEHGNPPAQ